MKLFNRLPALLVAALIASPRLPCSSWRPGRAQVPARGRAAPAKPAPTPPAGAGEPAKETIENPYGLEALWKGGDFISKGTLIILVIMSMGSWYIMFVKVYEQMKLFKEAKAVQANFWGSASLQEGAANLKEGSPFRYIAESGLKATTHHEGKLLEQIDLNTWITMSVNRAVDNVT